MNTYYGTFGWGHKNPTTKEDMKDYYVTIEAKDLEQARRIMTTNYDNYWADVYEQNKFNSEFYPKGCYTILKSMFRFKFKKKVEDGIEGDCELTPEFLVNNPIMISNGGKFRPLTIKSENISNKGGLKIIEIKL